jgi:hypothetical protein
MSNSLTGLAIGLHLEWSPRPARQGRSLQHQPRKRRHQHGRPLRYRLLDIDRLISRTLVYGLLTAVLAGVYAIGVFVSGRLLDPTTSDSALAVAASTLAVAGLFQPLRSASSAWSTGASTDPATTRPGPWRPSAAGYGRRSTWTASRLNCSW